MNLKPNVSEPSFLSSVSVERLREHWEESNSKLASRQHTLDGMLAESQQWGQMKAELERETAQWEEQCDKWEEPAVTIEELETQLEQLKVALTWESYSDKCSRWRFDAF